MTTDSERLDWIERMSRHGSVLIDKAFGEARLGPYRVHLKYEKTGASEIGLRGAIDAAMSAAVAPAAREPTTETSDG